MFEEGLALWCAPRIRLEELELYFIGIPGSPMSLLMLCSISMSLSVRGRGGMADGSITDGFTTARVPPTESGSRRTEGWWGPSSGSVP